MTVLEGHSIAGFSSYKISSTLKCRLRDSKTMHCQFRTANLTVHQDSVQFHEDEDSWFQAPFDIKFNRLGIESLVILRDMETVYLDMVRAFVSQINVGVELLHKPDGAFQATESFYIGKCESLVNVSRLFQEYVSLEKEDIEIVPMTGIKKQHGEVLLIDKTRNLNNCIDKRNYALFSAQKSGKMQMVSKN